MKVFKLLILLSLMSLSGNALAEDAKKDDKMPPGVPEGAITTYPDLEYGSKGNASGVFLDLGLGFGQVKSTEPSSTPGIATLFHIEPGYVMSRGSWSRVEASLQLLSGSLTINNDDDRGGDGTFSIGLGAIAKFGMGYSLGKKLFGVWKVGVGPVMANAKFKTDGVTGTKDGLNGILYQVGYGLVMPMSDALDATGGFTWSQVQFNVDEVDVDGTSYDLDQNFVLNIPQLELGIRLKI
jgi:hypothetical protein